ncbi:MAG TPA: hypothetical protein V6C93_04845, partial [Allocoleopsis sp.]
MTDPEKEPEKQQGLSKEAWTAISAIAVALIGLFPVIWNTFFPPPPGKSSDSSSPSTPVPTVSSPSPPKVANTLLGKWSGVAKDPSGTSFPINVEINRDCSLKEKCGYISVPKVPCYGEITLISVNNNKYEFDVSNFDSRSNLKLCQPGAGEVFHLIS